MIEIVGLILSVIGTISVIGSGLFWWVEQKSKASTKAYAAQQDFRTIIELLMNLSSSTSAAFKEFENKMSDLALNQNEAKRDLGHCKNSLIQLTNNLANDFQDNERKLDEIKSDIQEIKFECRIDKK